MIPYFRKQRFLVLDIETTPTTDPALIDTLREKLAPPANYKKPESIAEWHRTQGVEALQEKIAGTALKGTQGDIIAIGWQTFALGDGVTGPDRNLEVLVRRPDQRASVFLGEAFDALKAETTHWHQSRYIIAGHNIVNFDLPFLWQQALRYEVTWPYELLPVLPSPHDRDILDTMTGIVGYRNTISLRDTARAFGIPWDENIPSADVPTAWQNGDSASVIKHLVNDVLVTSQVAHRIAATIMAPDHLAKNATPF